MDYSKHPFHQIKNEENIFLNVVLSFASRVYPPDNVLDIGCGAGQILDAIMTKQKFSHCFGIDLSSVNVAESRTRLHKYSSMGAVDIIQGDYLQVPFKPSQLVVSSSTLHLIPVQHEELFAKLREEVASGGYLIFSVPSCCWYNKILMSFRRLLKVLDCEAIRAFVLFLATQLHPSIDKGVLQERVPYMFIVPAFLFGVKEDALVRQNGFAKILDKKMPFILGKLQHFVFVYEKK